MQQPQHSVASHEELVRRISAQIRTIGEHLDRIIILQRSGVVDLTIAADLQSQGERAKRIAGWLAGA